MLKKKMYVLIISLTVIATIFSGIGKADAHDPRFIDLKYFADENRLSSYITHGVSDSEFHYIDEVTIELYELDPDLIEEFKTNPDYLMVSADPEDAKEKWGDYMIEEKDVFGDDIKNIDHYLSTLNRTFEMNFNYTLQDHHQINQYNYTLTAPEWTLIVYTAHCSLNGTYTQTLISGHPWFDLEHSMLEAVVPTIVCTIIVMTPLAFWRIFGTKPKEVKH